MSLRQSEFSIAENDTLLRVTALLGKMTSRDITVEVTISDGSANGNVQ